ncbi:hypothetical protein F5Y15DRAFT_25352 [Xylariaceae sp. FL0016]|nr:hypothetical protein F5Y15DRAFT_25352 [Xylariaceae sp. FL0016]
MASNHQRRHSFNGSFGSTLQPRRNSVTIEYSDGERIFIQRPHSRASSSRYQDGNPSPDLPPGTGPDTSRRHRRPPPMQGTLPTDNPRDHENPPPPRPQSSFARRTWDTSPTHGLVHDMISRYDPRPRRPRHPYQPQEPDPYPQPSLHADFPHPFEATVSNLSLISNRATVSYNPRYADSTPAFTLRDRFILEEVDLSPRSRPPPQRQRTPLPYSLVFQAENDIANALWEPGFTPRDPRRDGVFILAPAVAPPAPIALPPDDPPRPPRRHPNGNPGAGPVIPHPGRDRGGRGSSRSNEPGDDSDPDSDRGSNGNRAPPRSRGCGGENDGEGGGGGGGGGNGNDDNNNPRLPSHRRTPRQEFCHHHHFHACAPIRPASPSPPPRRRRSLFPCLRRSVITCENQRDREYERKKKKERESEKWKREKEQEERRRRSVHSCDPGCSLLREIDRPISRSSQRRG